MKGIIMPKLKGIDTQGKKPYQKALDVLKLNVPVTPKEIDDYVGTGTYSSKYICFLKRDGYQFVSVKMGRSVVSYTLTAMGKPFDVTAKVTKLAVPKVAKPKKVQPVTVTKTEKAAALKTLPAKKPLKPRVTAPVEKNEDPADGMNETSFSVDSGFDDADIGEIMDSLV